MLINNLSTVIEDVYYDHDFIIMIESNMSTLRSNPNVRMLSVDVLKSYKYEGDFYGLLDDLNIDKKFHFIVLRFNGYTSSADFVADIEYILMPDFDEIELLKSIFLTKKD